MPTYTDSFNIELFTSHLATWLTKTKYGQTKNAHPAHKAKAVKNIWKKIKFNIYLLEEAPFKIKHYIKNKKHA